jgi:hypothetical protein
MRAPKNNQDKLDKISDAWQTLAPDKSFGGMTLAQFRAGVKPSYDSRERIRTLENQLISAQAERESADEHSLRVAQLVVNGIIGDPTEGPDSDLYEACGYKRASERKSGLTRKHKSSKETSK